MLPLLNVTLLQEGIALCVYVCVWVCVCVCVIACQHQLQRKGILPDATGLCSHSKVYHLKAFSHHLSLLSFNQPPPSPALMRYYEGEAYAQLAVEAWQKELDASNFLFSRQHKYAQDCG